MFFYYIAVALLLLLAGPFLLVSGKRRAGLAEKLGFVPERIRSLAGEPRPTVWFHAVSVGEFNALWGLVRAFADRHPDVRIAISTATATAQELARQRAPERALVFYFPLDLPLAIRPWLDAVRPDLVVICETEIWPGFTAECRRRGISVGVVNGRISSRSFPRYMQFRALFRPVIRSFKFIAAQSETDRERYRLLAGPDIPATCTGNLKFDGLDRVSAAEAESLRAKVGIDESDLVLVAGSTHEGEEEAVLAAFRQALSNRELTGPCRRLILAPRHPERFERVAQVVGQHGFRARRFSAGERLERDDDVYLLDSIGHLCRHYAIASVAFVGGTLAPIGGHNLIEPLAFGVPVVCGPSLDKTLDVARTLKDRQALWVVSDAGELGRAISSLFSDRALSAQYGENGRSLIAESEGAVKRTLSIMEPFLTLARDSGGLSADGQQGVLAQ